MMGNNKRKNQDFLTAFRQVCAEFKLDANDGYLQTKAHDALPGNYWETDKDDLTFQELKQRIKDTIVR